MADSEKKIVVVAVDQSDHAEQALQYYLTYLHHDDHKVVLVHAAEVPKMKVPEHGVEIEQAERRRSLWQEASDMREVQLKALHRHLESVMTSVEGGVDHEILITQFHHGHMGEAIVDQAADRGATMIVIGSRGLGTIRRTILGSVSDYVLHHAKCPVMVCHFEAERYHHIHEARKSH